jgi:transposase-like protein
MNILPEIKSLWEFMVIFPDDNSCREYLYKLRWPDGAVCPYCKTTKIYHYSDDLRYKCSKCRKQFRVTTNTVFDTRNLSLQKMFLAYYLLTSSKKGISSIQLSRYLQITQKTAWNLSHKIKASLVIHERGKLTGVVEMDETYVGGKRRFSKRGRGAEHKTPVFGILQRDGELRIWPVANVKAKTLKDIIYKHVAEGSTVMTDEFRVYRGLSENYIHKTVNHSIKQYVDGDTHVNSLEGFWGLLKRGIRGVYHRPSRKYLHNYCTEFEFRYNTRHLTDNNRFRTALLKSEK